MLLPSANWLDWYYVKHVDRSAAMGQEFEDYFELVMMHRYPDYINPKPAGSLGDGGCDGAAEAGREIYACYGSRAKGERKLAKKLLSDFERARSEWPLMQKWTFVTNAAFGPLALKNLHTIQNDHGPATKQPIAIQTWDPKRLWVNVVRHLPLDVLDSIFPGVPGSANVELQDLVPLLHMLGGEADDIEVDPFAPLGDVPPTKLDFNAIPLDTRVELNSGRRLSKAIDRWFNESGDPTLEDRAGQKFRRIYAKQTEITRNPKEIIERLYVSLAGSNIRLDSKRAECVFAVTAYFFDKCHIFERPPDDWDGESTFWSSDGEVAS